MVSGRIECVNSIIQKLLSVDFLKFCIPVLGVTFAWFKNETRRLASEEYLRKEERYRELLRSMSGFYENSSDLDGVKTFIEEYRKCWLYCDDTVIKAANEALEIMRQGSTVPMDQKHLILGNFVLALRRDLLSRKLTKRTELRSEDFMHMAPGSDISPAAHPTAPFTG
jgi:hypothetical protein